MNKLLIASATMLFLGGAFAQNKAEPIAKITELEGLVTVADKNQMVNGALNMPLDKGARVLTTSSGFVTITFDTGCRVRLRTNQSFTVDEEECKALLASSGEGIVIPPGREIVLGIGAAGLVGVILSDKNKKLSGS